MTTHIRVILALAVIPAAFDMSSADPLAVKLFLLWLAACLAWPLFRPASPGLACAAWCLWSWSSALYHGLSSAWLLLLPPTLSLYWSCASIPRELAERAALTGWLFSAIYSWVQRLGIDPFPWSHPEHSQLRTIAALGNPNYLAMYLAALLPVIWPRLYRWGPPGWLLAILGTSALLLTATRGSILALALVTILATFAALVSPRFSPGRSFWILTWVLLLGTAGGSWWYSRYYEREHRTSFPNQVVKVGRSDFSVVSRLALWKSALRQGIQFPLAGVGPGNFGDYYLLWRGPEQIKVLRDKQRRPENSHNEALQVLCETGLIGLGLWLAWLGLLLRHYLRYPSPHGLGFLVLLLNGATNCYPLAIWPLLAWWGNPPSPESPPLSKRLPNWVCWTTALTMVVGTLASLLGWKCQRDFWWDDEYQIRQLSQQRLQCVLGASLIAPPWYQEEVLRRGAAAFASLQMWPQAEEWSLRRLRLLPGNPFAVQAHAAILEQAGKIPAACRAWQDCHEKDPQNPAVLYFWARCLAQSGRFSEAQIRASQSLNIHDESRQAWHLLSWLQLQQGQAWAAYWSKVHGLEFTP